MNLQILKNLEFLIILKEEVALKIEFKDNRKHDRFKNINLGDVFEYEYKLYIKIGYADDSNSTVNAFELLNNYKTTFKANDLVIPRNFILKEV